MRNILFIAWADLRYQLRQKETLLWLLIMPPVFFYFIGTVMGGFSSGSSSSSELPLAVVADDPGFLQAQIDRRLRDNGFAPAWLATAADALKVDGNAPRRTLTFPPQLTAALQNGETLALRFETAASSLSRNVEIIRIQRSVYTALADIVVASAASDAALQPADIDALNDATRSWQLVVTPAGQREEVPVGFAQAIPGIMVMFTLLVLLTSGASMLAIERVQGLLRRLAYTPVSRAELVGGKWLARMGLAVVQIATAILVGTLLFGMQWGPDFAMVLLVLLVWAGFCASAGLLLGCIARTEGQAAGLGVLAANALAALGGCWWPIEITPAWMQALQNLLPTGWTMDALHRLISFEAGAAAALPQLALLVVGAAVVGVLAIMHFRYE